MEGQTATSLTNGCSASAAPGNLSNQVINGGGGGGGGVGSSVYPTNKESKSSKPEGNTSQEAVPTKPSTPYRKQNRIGKSLSLCSNGAMVEAGLLRVVGGGELGRVISLRKKVASTPLSLICQPCHWFVTLGVDLAHAQYSRTVPVFRQLRALFFT